MPVNSLHPKYSCESKRWQLVRAIIANKAKCYIRTVDINDVVRSQQYRDDAILTNFTRLTRDGLVGLVARKPSTTAIPKNIQYILDDATGENTGLDHLANQVIGEILETGRYGLFVDYPKATPDISDTDRESQGFYSRIKPYTAESIINWNYKIIGSRYVLSQVVLKEEIYEPGEDGFEWVCKTHYRVLYLDYANVYAYAIYNDENEIIESDYPQDINGNTWNEIPFQFIGATCNDAGFDEIPLYDLAVVNLGHYRNSADLEESSFITGQPYLTIDVGEASQEQFEAANPSGVAYGSRKGLVLGKGGKADLLQANPNQLADQLMKRKEEQAAAIGARLISPPGGRETAEAARIRYGSQNSSLYVITTNISIAITQCLKWVCNYQGANPETVKFELNTQFYEDSADPNLIAQQLLMLDRGIISKNDIRDYGRQTGFIGDSRTDEELDAEATPAPIDTSSVPSDVANT